MSAPAPRVSPPRRGTLNGRISRRLTSLTHHCPCAGGRPPHHVVGPGGHRMDPHTGATGPGGLTPAPRMVTVLLLLLLLLPLPAEEEANPAAVAFQTIVSEGPAGHECVSARAKSSVPSGGGTGVPGAATKLGDGKQRRCRPSPRACRCMPLTQARYRPRPCANINSVQPGRVQKARPSQQHPAHPLPPQPCGTGRGHHGQKQSSS